MKNIAVQYQQRIKLATNAEAKQHIAEEFHIFYEKLSVEQKLELEPFFEEIKQSALVTIKKLDTLSERAEILLASAKEKMLIAQ
jgi:hypothetical protein